MTTITKATVTTVTITITSASITTVTITTITMTTVIMTTVYVATASITTALITVQDNNKTIRVKTGSTVSRPLNLRINHVPPKLLLSEPKSVLLFVRLFLRLIGKELEVRAETKPRRL